MKCKAICTNLTCHTCSVDEDMPYGVWSESNKRAPLLEGNWAKIGGKDIVVTQTEFYDHTVRVGVARAGIFIFRQRILLDGKAARASQARASPKWHDPQSRMVFFALISHKALWLDNSRQQHAFRRHRFYKLSDLSRRIQVARVQTGGS
jgi:hypothetical protein